MLRDGDEGTADEVAHLGRAPEHEHDDRRRLAGKIPAKGPRGAKIHQKEQHHLGHDADEFQIHPEDGFQDGIFEGHQHTQQDAQRQADEDGHSADLKRHAQTAQQANHIFALEQDFKTQIRHSAASFPASCPAGTPAAG